MATNTVANTLSLAEELLEKCKEVSGRKTMIQAGVSGDWMETYAQIVERADREQRFGLTRYPIEAGAATSAFTGGFFDNEEWTLRRKFSKQQSMFSVVEHEAKYVNAAGYWSAMHNVAYALRQENFDAGKKEEAEKFDVWVYIFVRYSLRVLDLLTEFYRMASKDPMHAKLVLPSLERRG